MPSFVRPLPLRAGTLAGFIAIALLSTSCFAGTWTAYGPKTYSRDTGSPVMVSDTFTILNANTQYTLRVHNGGLVDAPTDLVSSTTVMVNGVTVVAPNDLNQTILEVDRPVTLLAGSNEIDVQVRGAPGGSLSIDIIGVDNDLPKIVATPDLAPGAHGWNNSDITVTFSCIDATSGIAVCPPPVLVNTEGANRVISGQTQDNAGNVASTSIILNIDKTIPSIIASATPAANPAGWNNSDVSISYTCSDSLSGIAICPNPVNVSTEGTQTIAGNAADIAGNTAAVSTTVRLDKTPPSVSITSPAPGTVVKAAVVTLTGTVNDTLSGVTSVHCNGVDATLSGSSFTCSPSLLAGPNSIQVVAADAAGNSSAQSIAVSFTDIPKITITSPTNSSLFSQSPVNVTGTVEDPSAQVDVNGIPAPVSGGNFLATVPLQEGTVSITAVAHNSNGSASTASVQVILDTTPPHVAIYSPADQSTTSDDSVTVTGLINDIVVGTVNPQDAAVTVNGVPAQVANRSFTAANISLVLGKNTIHAVGVDRAGNAATATVTVTRLAGGTPVVKVFSGNNQSGPIRTTLPQPLVAQVLDASGRPLANIPVVFRVTAQDGTFDFSSGPGLSDIAVNTDPQGLASVGFRLGSHAGAGNNLVEASATGITATAVFSASAISTGATQIVVDSGLNQSGATGQSLPLPFIAVVTDAGHNRIPNVPVTFTVKQGGGVINGQPSLTVTSDGDGRVQALLTLGNVEGVNNNVVEATFLGNTASPASFSATAKVPGAATETSISGVVLDNSNLPIPGVTMRMFQLNQGPSGNLPQQVGTPVQTDDQGQFTIKPAPVGVFKLMADGGTAQRPGPWPTLEYDLTTVSGQRNTVGSPIYLPQLNAAGKLCVSETQGGTLTMPQAPGFSLTIVPGSATFPGGSRTGCVTVSPVNMDKVPMVPGFGQQPRFVVTIQPVGTMFNPPAAITFPNVDGLPPRAVTEMYSYDHDLASFVAIGAATVSDDGSLIRSNPGVGVLKAGWHCGGDPTTNGTVADCPTCKFCQNNSCVLDPAQDKKACTSSTVPKGVCTNAQCVPVNVKIDASYINKDDPSNTSFATLPDGTPVYAGSENSTSDSLQLNATLDPSSPPATNYTWSVTGPGSSAYTPPPPSPTATQWNVGRVNSPPGTLSFQVQVDFSGVQAQDKRDIDVGIRTDDTIVVGWINPAGVTLPGGASPAVTGLLTPPPVPSSLQCNLFVLDLSENFTTPNFIPLTPADRSYVLNWLFKFAGNTDPTTVIPGGDFRNAATSFTDDGKVNGFVGTPTNFKLFNRFQIKFTVAQGGGFNGAPTVLHQQTAIGTTHNPCGTVLGFLGLFPGQAGPANGPPAVPASPTAKESLINDGSPDAGAVRAFNTLTGKDLPAGTTAVFWENIGTRIAFTTSGPSPTVTVQPYPTYYEYHNGNLVNTTPQAATPLGNFQTNPYPFGTVNCLGLGGVTPGGRCGDASSAADPSARVPAYTLP